MHSGKVNNIMIWLPKKTNETNSFKGKKPGEDLT